MAELAPIYSIAGEIAIALLIGIGLGYWFYHLQVRQHHREFAVLPDVPVALVDLRPDVRSKLELTYDGERIENLYLVSVGFVNTGKQSLTATDLAEPIEIQLSEGFGVLEYELVYGKDVPQNAFVNEAGQNTYQIRLPMLNPKEGVVLRFRCVLESGATAEASDVLGKCICRIPNCKIVSGAEAMEFKFRVSGVMALAMATLIIAVVSIAGLVLWITSKMPWPVWAHGLLWAGVILGSLWLLSKGIGYLLAQMLFRPIMYVVLLKYVLIGDKETVEKEVKEAVKRKL